MDDAVVKTVRTIEEFGKKAYEEFVKEHINPCTKEIEDLVKKNKFPLFSTMYGGKQSSRSDIEKKSLKNDVRVLSQLFIATQTRDGDLDTFFSHENSANPSSIACDGKIQSGVKTDLLPCLKISTATESSVAANTSGTQIMFTPDSNDSGSAEPEGAQIILTVPKKVDGKVLEGSVLVNLLKPTKESTFAEYVRTVFVPKVTKNCKQWSVLILFLTHTRKIV